jgi:O-antigen/teichoic acid export membrane protein
MSAVSCRNQGTAILLNQFFGAAIVSARNIAFSVNSALASVMFNFTMALRPQIIKNYATNNREKMLSLTFLCSKISYYLMYIVSLPFILEMPFILSVWLQNFPEYTVMFTRLISIELLMVCLTTGQAELVKASEQIKIREIIYAVVFMFNLPLSWFFLNFVNALPYSVSCIMIFLTIIEFILQLFIARRLINFPILAFLKAVIMPILIITLLSLIVPVMLIILLNQSFLRLCLVFAASIVSSCICIFLFGFDKMEKNGIKRIVMNKIRLWKK